MAHPSPRRAANGEPGHDCRVHDPSRPDRRAPALVRSRAPVLSWVDQSELTTLSSARPFASSDVFNTPIAANPEIDPNSARWVTLLEGDAAGANLANNLQWGIPVYQTTESDPAYALAGSVYYTSDYFLTHVPRTAVANTGADQHLVVLGNGVETDFWGFSRSR
jgi:hypothetical protein